MSLHKEWVRESQKLNKRFRWSSKSQSNKNLLIRFYFDDEVATFFHVCRFSSYFLNDSHVNSQSKYFSKYVSLKFRVHLNTSKHYIELILLLHWTHFFARRGTFFPIFFCFFLQRRQRWGENWEDEEMRKIDWQKRK